MSDRPEIDVKRRRKRRKPTKAAEHRAVVRQVAQAEDSRRDPNRWRTRWVSWWIITPGVAGKLGWGRCTPHRCGSNLFTLEGNLGEGLTIKNYLWCNQQRL